MITSYESNLYLNEGERGATGSRDMASRVINERALYKRRRYHV